MTKMLSSLAVIYDYNLHTSRWQPAESPAADMCLTVTVLAVSAFMRKVICKINVCKTSPICLRVTAASPGRTAIGCLPLGDLRSILTIKGRHLEVVWLVECSTSGWLLQ